MASSLNVGGTVSLAGFFTEARWLRMQPGGEIERRLGFRTGRLAEGWWLLFMTELPGVDDFEVRGYSHMSGGVHQGHLADPPDPRTAERRLADAGHDMHKVKSGVRRRFQLAGAHRLAKVVPVAAPTGSDDYPQGAGIPQWTLVRPKTFKVAALVPRGRSYDGHYT